MQPTEARPGNAQQAAKAELPAAWLLLDLACMIPACPPGHASAHTTALKNVAKQRTMEPGCKAQLHN
jgi:hypothetical protein